MTYRVDVAIIGAGFAGSILAWILSRQGMRVALIDSARHPRFAVGESSTPIADATLARLGEDYNLPDLTSLATYGAWQKSHQTLACGRKRGFSYFVHQKGQAFREQHLGQQSLLVAASPTNQLSDTHWYRPEVDEFFWCQAISAGAIDLTHRKVIAIEKTDTWAFRIQCHRHSDETIQGDNIQSTAVACQWIIDASGRSAVTAKQANRPDLSKTLRTRTHSTYAHYRGVGRWSQLARAEGIDTGQDPFDADDAAQHHLVEGGWVWMLRFNNGITSVGYTTTIDQPLLSLERLAATYPTLGKLTERSTMVAPASGPIRSGRLQRWFDPVIDHRRILLPTAAVTLDPLHSTGIAHALVGVERVCRILGLREDHAEQKEQIEQYRRSFLEETKLLDALVSTAYRVIGDFDRFTAACMLYFAGAIRCEERFQRGETPSHLWNADDPEFVDFVSTACGRLLEKSDRQPCLDAIRAELEPWNSAGLMNAACQNRYAYTATKNAKN